MNSKMKISLTLIFVAALALGVVNSVSAVDLGVDGMDTIDSISYNANSNEIKNVENEINSDFGYSDNGISEGYLIQESGNSNNGNAMDPVLNSENESNYDLQFINDENIGMEHPNTPNESLINSINMVNIAIEDDNGSINSIENMMLTPNNANNAIENGEICLETSIITQNNGNNYANVGITNSNEETNMIEENHESNLNINVINLNENENQFENNIDANYNSTITVTINNLTYGNNITGTVTVTGNGNPLNGTVTLTINNKSINITVINGIGDINNYMDLAVGTYNLTATYLGNDDYKPSEETTEITVNKKNVTMDIKCENITYGSTETIEIFLSENITGYVAMDLNNNTLDMVDIINGHGNINVPSLNAGEYNISALFFSLNENYSNAENTTSFIVSKAQLIITAKLNNMEYTQNLTGQIGLSTENNLEPVTGNYWVTVRVDNSDKSFNVYIKNGVVNINERVYYEDPALSEAVSVEYHYLPVGIHTYTIEVAGDNNYLGYIYNGSFEITKATPQISVSVEGEYIIIVNLPMGIIDPIKVYVNGVEYQVNVTQGVAKLQLDSLAPGTYYVEAVFDGNDNYYGANATTTFTVSEDDYNEHVNASEENLLLKSTSNETGNPIALLIMALLVVLPIRKVFKK